MCKHYRHGSLIALSPLLGLVILSACVPPDVALIPAGTFAMGDHFNEGSGDELPVHNVTISGFMMDKAEVTNIEYKLCVDSNVCEPPDDDGSASRPHYYDDISYSNYPVVWVSWYDANTYCNWKGMRLPTEAEWEKAARGGLVGKRYTWGDILSGLMANYFDSGDPEDNDTNPVASYPANGYGLYDMAGNVSEWVKDWHDSSYYQVSPSVNPQGPTSGTERIRRGGDFRSPTDPASGINWYLRVARRQPWNPSASFDYMGFRCASSL